MKSDLEKSINILKEFGCNEIYIFGSLKEGRINKNSDIDIAVRGLKDGLFFTAWGKLIMELETPIDLINLDKNENFSNFLFNEDLLVRVA